MGVSEEDLKRVHAPIGLSINAETPQEIAVSIIAEIIKIRRSEGPKGESVCSLWGKIMLKTIDDIQKAMERAQYICGRPLATSVYLSKVLGKPLLLEGEAGVGKTEVGKVIAEKGTAAGVAEVAFDRGGFRYHGRVKALADAAREGGLKFWSGARASRSSPGEQTTMAEILEDSKVLESTTVAINRTAKTVKGGRNMSFAALVVVGDRKGSVGIGYGKGRGVPASIEKAQKELGFNPQVDPEIGLRDTVLWYKKNGWL